MDEIQKNDNGIEKLRKEDKVQTKRTSSQPVIGDNKMLASSGINSRSNRIKIIDNHRPYEVDSQFSGV